jgi:hypothetical protein
MDAKSFAYARTDKLTRQIFLFVIRPGSRKTGVLFVQKKDHYRFIRPKIKNMLQNYYVLKIHNDFYVKKRFTTGWICQTTKINN